MFDRWLAKMQHVRELQKFRMKEEACFLALDKVIKTAEMPALIKIATFSALRQQHLGGWN